MLFDYEILTILYSKNKVPSSVPEILELLGQWEAQDLYLRNYGLSRKVEMDSLANIGLKNPIIETIIIA